MNLNEQDSTIFFINGTMGKESPLPAINIEELNSDWHLFELRIFAPKPPDQNCANLFKQQSTKFTQPDSAMAPNMRGSLPDAAKSKARVTVEARKKVAKD